MSLLDQLTAVIPCKNEEKNIDTCLGRLEGFCRCVVADSGSTDNTLAIAERHGATILQFEWNGQFPKKRNWVLRTHDFQTPWVIFLDADEFVTPEFRAELKATLPDTPHNGFWLSYNNYFMGRLQRYGVPMRKLALLRVGKGEYEFIPDNRWTQCDMEVHEHVIVEGTVGEIRSHIIHHDQKDLEALIARHNSYSTWEAHRYQHLVEHRDEKWAELTFRQRTKYRLLNSLWFGPFYFVVNYVLKRGFLDGWTGFKFSLFKAYYFFQIYIKIQELRRQPKAIESDAS